MGGAANAIHLARQHPNWPQQFCVMYATNRAIVALVWLLSEWATEMEGTLPEIAKVFEDCEHPGEWRVEWFDGNGGCEVKIFFGANARGQAFRYADQQYGKFEEVTSIPYP
jgi:hypothetical protein